MIMIAPQQNIYLFPLTMDIGCTWIYWQVKICGQFSPLIKYLFMGQFVQAVGGDGGILASCEPHIITLYENSMQHSCYDISIPLAPPSPRHSISMTFFYPSIFIPFQLMSLLKKNPQHFFFRVCLPLVLSFPLFFDRSFSIIILATNWYVSEMASKPINICWIRTGGSQIYRKILYSTFLLTIFHY